MGSYEVFVRCRLFGLLAVWVSSGTLWDLILGAFWIPMGAFLWFRKVLGTGWNFDVFWDLPCGTPDREDTVRSCLSLVPGSS